MAVGACPGEGSEPDASRLRHSISRSIASIAASLKPK
jgi:hypothetical protein